MSARVLAIVVSYNPVVAGLERLLTALVEQTQGVIVVDNASDNQLQIQHLLEQLQLRQLVYLQQDSNMGLGAAHNIGIDYARQHNYDYVLLMDQDSIPMSSMVAQLLLAHQLKSKQTKVSAVGVTYLNADNGSESFFVRFGCLKFKRNYCAARDEDDCIAADFLISSGSLIALSTLDEVGAMEPELFIDHIDTEWFLRARKKSFKAFGVCDAIMQHGLGENTHRIKLFNRVRNVPQHKPFRYYYIFRNSVLLYKRPYISGLWKWNDSQRLIMIALMFGVLNAPRWQNLRMMWRGLMDGLRGKTGQLQSD